MLGPGLNGWTHTVSILCGATAYVRAPTVAPTANALPAPERRRVGMDVKLALALGFEACAHADLNPGTLPTVFTSSGSDGQNCHELCQTLASADRQVSPTRFHNSVHNAAAGYWSIAAGAMTAATALCAYDASFSAGLIETGTQLAVGHAAVMLVAFDTGYPEPLHSKRPLADIFGVALVLARTPSERSIVKLNLDLCVGSAEPMHDSLLEALRAGVPAARSLPLLSCQS